YKGGRPRADALFRRAARPAGLGTSKQAKESQGGPGKKAKKGQVAWRKKNEKSQAKPNKAKQSQPISSGAVSGHAPGLMALERPVRRMLTNVDVCLRKWGRGRGRQRCRRTYDRKFIFAPSQLIARRKS